jgi:hypothetical protein
MFLPALAFRRTVSMVAATLALALLGRPACARGDGSAVQALTLPGAETLVAAGSEAGARDLGVDDAEGVYVADYRLAQVLAFMDSKSPRPGDGREGHGSKASSSYRSFSLAGATRSAWLPCGSR